MCSKRFSGAFVIEVTAVIIIIMIVMMSLNSKCLMAQTKPKGSIYTYNDTNFYDDDKFQHNASLIWDYIKGLKEAQLITSEKAYSVIIFMHEYATGTFDLETPEWIAVASSISETGEEVKVLIVRLDYQTLNLKGIDTFTYPKGIGLSLEEVISIMAEELRLYRLVPSQEDCEQMIPIAGELYLDYCPIVKKNIQLLGENYIYLEPPNDFGGTIIVNKYVDKPIFLASKVWAGWGRLRIPRESPLPERNIYIKGTATKGNNKEFRIPVRIQNAPCEVDTFGFEVTYDTNIFEYIGLERGDLSKGFKAVEANPTGEGRLRIEGNTDEHGISQSASGYLAWLKFKLKEAGEEDDIYLFQLENLEGDIAQFSKSGGCLSLRCAGDVNGDGDVTPGDALLAFKCYLKAGPCLECSNYNRDSEVTPEDARQIFQKYLESL